MKQKITIIFLGIIFSIGIFPQEILFDEDFNTTEWLDAFTEALSADGTTRDIRTSTEVEFDIGVGVDVKGFLFNGVVNRHEPSFTSVCGRTFQFNFRLRHDASTYIVFPEVVNAGKVSVYARNMNATTESFLNLQIKNELGEWDNTAPLVRWTVPGNEHYVNGASDILLTYDIDSIGPIELRLHRHQSRFMQIYRIVLEKYEPSSVRSTFKDEVKLNIVDKTILFSKELTGVEVTVYDFVGRSVVSGSLFSNEMSLQQLDTGIYIVKLKSPEGELVQKVSIK
jgi:hypothetical protein